MCFVCVVTDLQNPAGNFPTQMFIDSQVFTGIDDLSMIRIKDVPHMINDNNSVPNQEARLGTIQHLNLQALVWWMKDRHRRVLVIIATTWTGSDLTSYITQINIESPSEGEIKVAHSGKVEAGHKWKT